jgi:hypothetical protein
LQNEVKSMESMKSSEMNSPVERSASPIVDTLTVIAIACIAYILGVALHELAGHGGACLLLGGKLRELNAFYVDCDYRQMGDLAIRIVGGAGPLVSLLTGVVSFLLLRRIRQSPKASTHQLFFLWLLGTLGLMTATGYLLLSGIAGFGDFGVGRDGMLFELQPEWLWRVGIAVLGFIGYMLAVVCSIRFMEQMIGGSGPNRVARAQRLSLTAYLVGGLVSVLIGLFNPQGLLIVLVSAGASSLGGTSGLAWGMQMMNRKRQSTQLPFQLLRSWGWVAAGVVVVLFYGIVFGPSIKP